MTTQLQIQERKMARQESIARVRGELDRAKGRLAEINQERPVLQQSISNLGQELYDLVAGGWRDEV